MVTVTTQKPKAKQKPKIFLVNPDEEARIEARAQEWADATGYRYNVGPFSGFARYMLLHAEIPHMPKQVAAT